MSLSLNSESGHPSFLQAFMVGQEEGGALNPGEGLLKCQTSNVGEPTLYIITPQALTPIVCLEIL